MQQDAGEKCLESTTTCRRNYMKECREDRGGLARDKDKTGEAEKQPGAGGAASG